MEDEYKYRIKKALERDSQFFGKARLMDYSLLVIKIDWGQYKYNEKVDEQNVIDYKLYIDLREILIWFI